MQASELRAKSEKELLDLLGKTQEDMRKGVSDVLQGKSKNTAQNKQLRRLIAKIKTVLAEKELLGASESETPAVTDKKDKE